MSEPTVIGFSSVKAFDKIHGLSTNGGGGRVNQFYTVSYATIFAPTTFIDIATVSGATSVQESRFEISENATGILASNVATIRFVFPNTQDTGGTNYKEFDILGVMDSVVAPEPSSLALLLMGAGLLGARRKRRI